MSESEPRAELVPEFSNADAQAVAWTEARALVEQAELYWLSTVRPSGRPHATPLVGVWLEGAFYFCTGADERKALNLARNARCAITTGCNTLHGLDVVVEGTAARVHDDATLERVAAGCRAKYGPPFALTVRDGNLFNGEGLAGLYAVTAGKAFAFAKGPVFSQTRYLF